jgi:hypothetical protein
MRLSFWKEWETCGILRLPSPAELLHLLRRQRRFHPNLTPSNASVAQLVEQLTLNASDVRWDVDFSRAD